MGQKGHERRSKGARGGREGIHWMTLVLCQIVKHRYDNRDESVMVGFSKSFARDRKKFKEKQLLQVILHLQTERKL